MIKVLWVCNVPNQQACEYLGVAGVNVGGWLTGLSKGFENNKTVELVFCFPGSKKQIDFFYNGIHYYTFFEPKFLGIETNKFSPIQNKQIHDIIQREKPDIIHIFGTEFFHSLAFLNNSSDIITCCSIQGLVSSCSDHFLDLVPYKLHKKWNLSCMAKGTLDGQRKKLKKRGQYEIEFLKKCKYIIGRTEWDKNTTYFINSERIYYKCNESLRDLFYKSQWDFSKCIKHRIFVSQASSPLKGFAVVISALSLLKKEFPDISVHVAGNNFLRKRTLVDKLKYSTYANYINKLITNYDLKDKVTFCGNLSEEQMINEYCSSHLFISASSIENSSNSVSEAMILGVPVVSSNVGGIKSMIEDGVHGTLYQMNDPVSLAACIKKVFDDEKYASSTSIQSRNRALEVHDRINNTKTLEDIYTDLINRESK